MSLNLTKAEAARLLNISAAAYGRYEKGEREPSYQMVNFIAGTFQCNINFLYGITDNPASDTIQITSSESPVLYEIVRYAKNDSDMQERLLAYIKAFTELSHKK